jgi:hypothetical protein
MFVAQVEVLRFYCIIFSRSLIYCSFFSFIVVVVVVVVVVVGLYCYFALLDFDL